jgi:lysozyme family protein
VIPNFAGALELTLSLEGSWSWHPDDPGGATMRGITLKTYSNFLGRDASPDELRAISDADTQSIYRRDYWDAVQADSLASGVDVAAFDFAVNSGPRRAIKIMQKLAMAEQDGVIGPKTLKRVWERTATYGAPKFVEEYSDLRQRFLEKLTAFKTFGRGWTARVDTVRSYSRGLALTERL